MSNDNAAPNEEEEFIAGVVYDEGNRAVKITADQIKKELDDVFGSITFGSSQEDEIRFVDGPKDGIAKFELRIFDHSEHLLDGGITILGNIGSGFILTPGPIWFLSSDRCRNIYGSMEGLNGCLAVDNPSRVKPFDDDVPKEIRDVNVREHDSGLFIPEINGEPVSMDRVVFSIAYRLGLMAAYEHVKKSIEESQEEQITVAQYKTDSVFSNHSLAMKAFNGMFAIAMGKPYYELSPKRKGSKEVYRLTASSDSCSRFFYECGGNTEQIKDVLETVYTLRTDKRALGFLCEGRVWFTVNTIVEEMRRTTAGTVPARKFKSDRELVDAALMAASSAQISGIKPNGEPTDVMYALNAVRKDIVHFRGAEYRDVWGFMPEGSTINDYARAMKQTYTYPLLVSDKPLTIDEAWVDRYLRDVLNNARDKIYKHGKSKFTITRSWESIFETAFPMKTPTSRQKQKIVNMFEKVLRLQADMDKNGDMRKGRPLYINAHSKRDSSRGRGRGAWVSLVIECSKNTHVPKIDLQ